jgi:hypothetical protein
MSKPFNIHDWQAKQRQLSEIRAQDVPGTAAFMGKNMRSGKMSNSEKNRASVDAFFKDLRDKEENPVVAKGDGLEITQDEMEKLHKNGRVKLKNGSVLVYMKEETINEALNPEVSRMVNRFIKGIAQKYSYSEQDAVFAIMAALKQRDFDGVNEHHAGDYKPGFLKQSVNTFLDKLKKKTKEGKDYKTVEKIMEKYFSAKKKNEASTTGTGASFTAGTGAAYATPKAFGDDKRKKKKGYMGYKEI